MPAKCISSNLKRFIIGIIFEKTWILQTSHRLKHELINYDLVKLLTANINRNWRPNIRTLVDPIYTYTNNKSNASEARLSLIIEHEHHRINFYRKISGFRWLTAPVLPDCCQIGSALGRNLRIRRFKEK